MKNQWKINLILFSNLVDIECFIRINLYLCNKIE
jgi:hypothetical protein